MKAQTVAVDGSLGKVHEVRRVARFGGFALVCTGRYVQMMAPTTDPITCRACARKVDHVERYGKETS